MNDILATSISLLIVGLLKLYFYTTLPLAITMFEYSGRLDSVITFYLPFLRGAVFFITIIEIIELINFFINKDTTDYGDKLKDAKNQIIFKKSNDNI